MHRKKPQIDKNEMKEMQKFSISNKHIVGDIFFKISTEFLDDKNAAKLAGTFSLFRKQQLLQRPKRAKVWGERFMAIGVNHEAVKKMVAAQVIQDYESLYKRILKIEVNTRAKVQAWELYCMSGETLAIQKAIDAEGLNSFSKGIIGKSVLSITACSGSIEAIKFIRKKLTYVVSVFAVRDAFYNAARFGTAAFMRYINNIFYFPDSSYVWPSAAYAPNRYNALHAAASVGSVENMKAAIEIGHYNKNAIIFPRNDKYSDEFQDDGNALTFAAMSDSLDAVKYCVEELKIPAITNRHGVNPLHIAAYYGSNKIMRYLYEQREVLKISADSIDKSGWNALHYAALGGVPDAVISARCDLGLNPNTLVKGRFDTFWYAHRPRCHPFIAIQSKEKIIELLKMPIEDLQTLQKHSERKEEKTVNTYKRNT